MNLLEYWNYDILPLDLPEQAAMIEVATGIAKFDIVMALAIVQHMEGGYQPWLADLVKDTFYLEGNWLPKGAKFQSGWERDFRTVEANTGEQYSEDLARDFRQVEWLGWIKDEDRRPLYRCWKSSRPKWGPLPKGDAARKAEAVRRGQSIFGQALMSKDELAYLYDMAAIAPDGLAIEIGTFNGSAAMTWASARLGRGEIIVVDTVARDDLRENIKHSGYPIEVKIADSTKMIPPEMAFCFIDGDHTKTGIPHDIKIYPPRVAPGGVLVFHDFDPKEGPKGKGYVVYGEVKAWHKRNGWELLGQAGRLIAFRRPT
jgi:predicted O-methyltransferase YrrM